MSQRNRPLPQRGGGGHRAKLVGMGHRRLGHRTFGQLSQQASLRPDGKDPVPLTHLDDRSGHGGIRGQAIQDPIVGQIAIPPDFTLFGGKAFPGKGDRQGRERLLFAALSGAFVRGAMHAAIDALTPGMCLTVEVIDIAEANPRPEALFDEAD